MIWTRVANSIFNIDNRYSKRALDLGEMCKKFVQSLLRTTEMWRRREINGRSVGRSVRTYVRIVSSIDKLFCNWKSAFTNAVIVIPVYNIQ